jgi:cytochrome c
MDSFELSKIAAAILSALLVIVGFRTFLEVREEFAPAQKPGFTLPAPVEAAASGKEAEAAPAGPAFDAAAVAAAVAGANAENGATIFSKCKACHKADSSGANAVGPNLWGVVGRPRGSHAGFSYSEAMKSVGGDWTPEHLAAFIHSPKTAVPGTKMIFPGIPDANDLADLIKYLSTLK